MKTRLTAQEQIKHFIVPKDFEIELVVADLTIPDSPADIRLQEFSCTLLKVSYCRARFKAVRSKSQPSNRKNPMKKIFASNPALRRSRVLVCFGFGATALLMALLVFFALPKRSALATPKCGDVVIDEHTEEYGGTLYVTMTSNTPTPFKIFYTKSGSIPPNPTHDGSGNPTGTTLVYNMASGYEGVPVVPGDRKYFKAVAWKGGVYGDSDISPVYFADNSLQ